MRRKQRITKEIPALYRENNLRDALIVQRVFDIDCIESIFAGKSGLVKESLRNQLGWTIKKKLGTVHQEYISYLKTMDLIIETCNTPISQKISTVSQIQKQLDQVKSDSLEKLFLPLFDFLAYKEVDQVIRFRLALIALAMQQFKAKHQKYPEKLSSLTPNFLEKIPDNPYGNWEYQVLAKGYSIKTQGRKSIALELEELEFKVE